MAERRQPRQTAAGRKQHRPARLALIAALFVLAGLSLAELLGLRLSAQYAATWRQTGGPSGGKINALLVDAQNPSVVYAGTDGGVFISRDGGATWQHSSSGLLGDPSVQALAVDARAAPDRKLYAGTRSGVYRSDDNGQTWSKANEGLTQELVLSLAIDAADPSILYAGTATKLFRSTNGGDSWEESHKGLPAAGVWSLIAHPHSSNVVYAGTDQGVYKTTNGGGHWLRASDGIPDALRISALAMDPQRPMVLYAATAESVYRTMDGAENWQQALEVGTEIVIHALAIDPSKPSNLFAAAGTQGLLRTTDGGQSWAPTLGTLEGLVQCLAIHPLNSQVMWAGTEQGVYYSSTAGKSWESRNAGLIGTDVLVLEADPSNPGHLYASTGLDVHKTVDDGETWFSINAGFVRPRVYALAVDALSKDTVYAGTWTSEVYRSTDAGLNWVQVNGGLERDATIASMAIQYEPDGQQNQPKSVLFAGTIGAGVFRSTDGGVEWTAINSGLDDLRVQVLALAPEPASVLYAGTHTGISRLDLTRELIWQSAQEGLPQDEVSSIAIDPGSPSRIYAASATGIGKLFRSTDAGITWAAIGQGSLPTNARIHDLAFHSQSGGPNLLYAATDGGVLYSEDGGFSWQAINEGLPLGAKVLALAVDSERSKLYASVSNRGVYSSTITSLSRFTWSPALAALLGTIALATILLVVRWAHYSSDTAQQRVLDENWSFVKQRIQDTLCRRNQVTLDDLQHLPRGVPLRALQRYVQEQRDEDLILKMDPPVLLPANARQVGDLIRNWEAAQRRREDPSAFRAVVARLASQLCQLLGFALVASRSYKNLHGYVIRAPALRLNMPPAFPIIFLQKRDPVEEDIRSLDDLMAILNVPSYLALLIVPDESENGSHGPALKTRFTKLRRGSAHDYILLEYKDLYSIFVAKDAEKRFISIMLEQVDLTVVSPYVTSGPVPESMFFGREFELKTITRTIKDESFAVTGSRKIGKTSVLAKLYRAFTALPEFHPLYLDCQAVQDYEDLITSAETAWSVSWTPRTPEHLVQLVSMVKARRREQLPVFLMDEVDALLQYDQTNQERLFRVCRALSQEGKCRFVFCGGRILYALQHNPDSALFNFCQTIHLGYLKPRDTARIVAEPMQEMGIALEEPNTLIQRIVDLSACHPNLVQYICHQLIVQINARGERSIRLSDLDAIQHSTEFGTYFAEVMWGNATALERLITLLMLDQSSITVPQVEAALRAQGLDIGRTDVERALWGLIFSSILSREGQSYTFAAPAFASIVAVTQDVQALIARAVQDVSSTGQA